TGRGGGGGGGGGGRGGGRGAGGGGRRGGGRAAGGGGAGPPARRYATAAELAADLQRFLGGEPIRARRVGPWQRLLLWARRRPTAAALLLVSRVAGPGRGRPRGGAGFAAPPATPPPAQGPAPPARRATTELPHHPPLG